MARRATRTQQRPWPTASALQVGRLGDCRHPSPVRDRQWPFVDEADRVLVCSNLSDLEPALASGAAPPSFEPAGPRERVFFEPAKLTCGILTCGGLCPGLNNVIRAIVLQLVHAYHVPRILGFRYGYAGLASAYALEPVRLTLEVVESLHEHGGTILGSSRGPQDPGDMVDTLAKRRVGILFVIGGDGGLRGAAALSGEIARRKLPISVIGVPKTIDNDLDWIWRSFGFSTAVEAAAHIILGAHAEAQGVWNGVGLVRLMGRHSGFIAAHATLASADVNFCLVPEVPFTLHGEAGFLRVLDRRLDQKHHAVIAVAEGAGQDLIADDRPPERDASGNVRLKDIGVFLRAQIASYFAARRKTVNIRYIDPSYAIRSLPANSFDAQLCLALGQEAVHAGMAGRTNMVVGEWNQRLTHVPIPLAISRSKQLDPNADIWHRVLQTTGQPASMVGRTESAHSRTRK